MHVCKIQQRTRMIDGQHFTPAVTDLVDSVTILRSRAADEAVEARQEQLLEVGEQKVDVVFHLERLHSVLVHMLNTHDHWHSATRQPSSKVPRVKQLHRQNYAE